MLPRAKGIAAEPAPQRGAADLRDETLRNHVLPDLLDRKPGQGESEFDRKLTSKRLNLNNEAGGKSGLYARSRLRLKARPSGEGESLAPLADDLSRCIQSSCDDIVGQPFIREKDDLGANHITIR
jgi:hypothetical protein